MEVALKIINQLFVLSLQMELIRLMEPAKHLLHVLMPPKINLLAQLIHHANGLKTQLEHLVLIMHVIHLPQELIVNQFQALMELHPLFVFSKVENVLLLIQEP